MPKMEGEMAVVYAEGDPLSSAGALNNFAKSNKFLKIFGRYFLKAVYRSGQSDSAG